MANQYTALNAYFMRFPVATRREKWLAFAAAHKVSLKRAYYLTRKHPKTYEALAITEAVTNFEVTRFDIFPELFNIEDIDRILVKVRDGKAA